MSTDLVRTQYWNLNGVNRTPISGSTDRAESRTDMERHLLAADAARNTALCTPGVAAGLQVSGTVGAAGVTVAPGTALDGAGRVVVLAAGGRAVVDPLAEPGSVQDIPTVQVTAAGVVLETTGLQGGDHLVTVTWRETEEKDAGLLVLRQTPWLRVVKPATFLDDGLQLPLASVTLTGDGEVAGLVAGARRLVGSRVGRLELGVPVTAAGVSAGQSPAVELVPQEDGGADLRVLPATGPPRQVLSVSGSSGDVHLGAALSVTGDVTARRDLTVVGGALITGPLTVSGPGAPTLSVDGAVDLSSSMTTAGAADFSSTVTVHGALTATTQAVFQGPVHAASALRVDGPFTAGGGALDALAVHGNAVVGAGANGSLRVRHVDGKQAGADGFDGLFLNWDSGTTVHVGGGQPADLEVTGKATVAGPLGVRTTAPAFDLHVNGTACAVTFCNPSDARLKARITELDDVAGRLARVRAVSFTLRHEGRDAGGARRAGVLAQDVQDVFPELVLPMGEDGLLAVDYAGLAGVLVGAVNELHATTQALGRRLEELVCAPGPDTGGQDAHQL
ncbi:Chaperone of endosialidase [Modestobacter sp. DSM 44400]|uniref:tail fiber domain-containing protein n=1 Tax=Modestobacter sp. DSM 44400 TaxID=1550230 RepID=UPI000897EAC6|nr:tail fiber domain-containing protein [Modestobacter sp. DSM 44400]SDY54999.1 Chaperone of endosialidase [Modestobacter sp. DSM 44400]